MKKIYLAGGWSDWRDDLMEKLDNAIWLDPRDAKNKETGEDFENWFEIETNMVKEADAVICYINKGNNSGYGGTYEVGMAYALNKPYLLINEKKNEYQWSMQTKGSEKAFKTFFEAFEWIEENGWMGLEVKQKKIKNYGTEQSKN